ncbi:MAG: hypothetical protein EOP20_01720, partial [Hyphomicrobiales bacterium]
MALIGHIVLAVDDLGARSPFARRRASRIDCTRGGAGAALSRPAFALGSRESGQRQNPGEDMSERSQIVLIWWSLIFMNVFGMAWMFLIGTLPLPPATMTAPEIAQFYLDHSLRIRLGAAVCSWTSAFTVPICVVASVQMARLEKGPPVWAVLQLIGGVFTSLFVVLPPLLWGIAAFSPDRPPEITRLVHESANLIFATATQYVVFQMVAITVISLRQTAMRHSPFPRWFGFFTIWTILITEVAVTGYLTRTGPFAWNGLFVFWIPLAIGSVWLIAMAVMMLR